MRQKFGQNFLFDKNIARNIIKAADLVKDDEVLEIGPGKGILTEMIAPLVKNLTAVEIDNNLFQTLEKSFLYRNINNVNLINSDILKYKDFPKHSYKIISNLPYNIATAVIQKILPAPFWTKAIFMIQKEVAHRIAAKIGTKEYGYISIFCQFYAGARILFDVSPKCFYPRPKVSSCIIEFINNNNINTSTKLFNLIKFCFSMRRKTILNSLTNFTELNKDKIKDILLSCALDPSLRPDRLSIDDFLLLTKSIEKHIINTKITTI
jgi:16S rRNA (adenine1518-N6/adenine1519-N6)-dimethyltransferase